MVSKSHHENGSTVTVSSWVCNFDSVEPKISILWTIPNSFVTRNRIQAWCEIVQMNLYLWQISLQKSLHNVPWVADQLCSARMDCPGRWRSSKLSSVSHFYNNLLWRLGDLFIPQKNRFRPEKMDLELDRWTKQPNNAQQTRIVIQKLDRETRGDRKSIATLFSLCSIDSVQDYHADGEHAKWVTLGRTDMQLKSECGVCQKCFGRADRSRAVFMLSMTTVRNFLQCLISDFVIHPTKVVCCVAKNESKLKTQWVSRVDLLSS